MGVWRHQFSPQGNPVLLSVGVGPPSPTQCMGPLVQAFLELFCTAFGSCKEKGLDQIGPSLTALLITLTHKQSSPSLCFGITEPAVTPEQKKKQTSHINQLECLWCLTFTSKKIKHYKTSKPHIKQADTTAVGPKVLRLALPRSVGIRSCPWHSLNFVLQTEW